MNTDSSGNQAGANDSTTISIGNLLSWIKKNLAFDEHRYSYTDIEKQRYFWREIYQPRKHARSKFIEALEESVSTPVSDATVSPV